MNPYEIDIDIVVQSKYPELLLEFETEFLATTEKFNNLRLWKITGEKYGAKEINKILLPLLWDRQCRIFGVYNDDLWFAPGWLEDVVEKLEKYHCVSPGYVETNDREIFKKAVAATTNEDGVIDLLYGPTHTFRTDIFRKIGIFDERFDWSIDDMDWAWRFHLNGMKSATSKKITTAHRVGATRTKNLKEWHATYKVNHLRFADKHGYRSYRRLREMYNEHKYFQQFAK